MTADLAAVIEKVMKVKYKLLPVLHRAIIPNTKQQCNITKPDDEGNWCNFVSFSSNSCNAYKRVAAKITSQSILDFEVKCIHRFVNFVDLCFCRIYAWGFHLKKAWLRKTHSLCSYSVMATFLALFFTWTNWLLAITLNINTSKIASNWFAISHLEMRYELRFALSEYHSADFSGTSKLNMLR